MAGGLITVRAMVNRKEGSFIIDTGAYGMVLNSRVYTTANPNSSKGFSYNAEVYDIRRFTTDDFSFGEFALDANDADLMDLTHLEKSKKTAIYGLIGYQNLKDYEVFIDFYLHQITLFKLDKDGKKIDEHLFTDELTHRLGFEMRKHSIVLLGQVKGESFKVILDTGAEVNHISKHSSEEILSNFIPTTRAEIMGVDGKGVEVIAGVFKNFLISGMESVPMPTVISDLSSSERAFGTNADAIVGYWWIKNLRFTINYKTKEICIIKWPHAK
jgi:hypothetical protein